MTIRQNQQRSAVKHVVNANRDKFVVGANENHIIFGTADGNSVSVHVNVDMTARQLLDAALDYQI